MKQKCYISDLKVGDYFKLTPTGKVYVRSHYDRSSKRFSYYDFDDVNNEHFATRSRRIIVDFEF